MKQMIESAFSFEMSKQQDDFSELFFYYVSGQDYLTNGKRLNDFLTTKNIVENQTRFMECLESVRIDDLSVFPKVKVSKEEVHKEKQNNVMIDMIKVPNKTRLSFFEGDSVSTEEIHLDRLNKEHVEAIFLTELCRQSCMVCVNNFLCENSDYYIIEEFKKFKNIVKRNEPVQIQVLPVVGNKRRGRGICVFVVFQGDVVCLTGFYQMIYTKRRDDV